jgi:hypothetical protein
MKKNYSPYATKRINLHPCIFKTAQYIIIKKLIHNYINYIIITRKLKWIGLLNLRQSSFFVFS